MTKDEEIKKLKEDIKKLKEDVKRFLILMRKVLSMTLYIN